MTRRTLTRLALISATALAGLGPTVAWGQEATSGPSADAVQEEDEGNTVVVTATRRSVSLQDVPINITAITGDALQEQRLDDVRDIAAFTPGLTIQDTGPRTSGTIVLRGLSASDVSSEGSNYDNAVATYIGEIPLYQDLKFIDIDRVEVLLGPQGTLYGVGTLAGAIRYLPNRPNPDKWEGLAHARVYDVAHADNPGFSMDGVINVPLIPGAMAFRSATGYYDDPGFIDYVYLLQQPSVSLPQPQRSGVRFGSIGTPQTTQAMTDAFYGPIGSQQQIAQNLYAKKDQNFERTFTSRNQLGIFPADGVNVYLSYIYQETKTNGSQSNSAGVLGSGRYENAARYIEPSYRRTHVFSAEIEADLGEIAQLVSATAHTRQNVNSQADVTDLLLDLDYGYELYPQFSGFTDSRTKREQFNQEVRLVSKHGGPLSWVIGGFYNENKFRSDYAEIVPGLAVEYFGPDIFNADYPREVEYASFTDSKVVEKAAFGEATFEITSAFQITGGVRYFEYESEIEGGIALPLLEETPAIIFDTGSGRKKAKDDGFVWKANTSYKFSDNLLIYGTYSKGYRIGGPNRVAPCPDPVPADQQNACALPSELFYGPDETENKEIGIRATLFDGRLTGTLAGYHIDWTGIQLDALTQFGATGITVNGGKAVSKGIEFNFQARPVRGLSIQGTYSYNDAKLTQDVPGLLTFRNPDFRIVPRVPKFIDIDAKSGDRLPGSTRHSASLGATYTAPFVGGSDLLLNWTATYTGDILTRPGARAYGEVLPDFFLHRASVTYKVDDLQVRLFADNIFDTYAVSSVGNDLSRRIINDNIVSRYYSQAVISPRRVGLEFTKRFR